MRDDSAKIGARQANENFNPRPSHEGRPLFAYARKPEQEISIHVPRMRDDTGYQFG